MIKENKVNVTVINNYSNFKIRLPLDWLEKIDISEDNKEITLLYEDNRLFIRKLINRKYTNLTKTEKNLQIKKFELLYGCKHEHKKDLINQMEEYFNISYRTAYRHLKENVSPEALQNTELVAKQEKNTRNINVMFVKIKESMMPIITIPTNLAILLLEGKSYEELKIKSAYEIYKNNFSYPILMDLDEKNKIISLIRK